MPGLVHRTVNARPHSDFAHPSGFEPLTYGSGDSNTLLGDSSKRSQTIGSVRVGTKGRVQPSHGLAPFSSPFAAPVLQGFGEHLLTVREVADRLRVSTATVYTLCQSGELPSIRVVNSIRVSERMLQAFLSLRAERKDGRVATTEGAK
jgi:excisionase family DNA binding protein